MVHELFLKTLTVCPPVPTVLAHFTSAKSVKKACLMERERVGVGSWEGKQVLA